MLTRSQYLTCPRITTAILTRRARAPQLEPLLIAKLQPARDAPHGRHNRTAGYAFRRIKTGRGFTKI